MIIRNLETDPFDQPTKSLSKAIEENNYQAALDAIEKKADVTIKTLFCMADASGNPKTESCTLLQIAIYYLNYKLVKLLLENGADPNDNSENRSTLEILISSVAAHKRIKSTIAKQILDLLLCYGLNPTPQWSKEFITAHELLMRTAPYRINKYIKDIKKHEKLTALLDIAIEDKIIPANEKNTYLEELLQIGRYVEQEPWETDSKFLADYVSTYPLMQKKLIDAAKDVHEEKASYTTCYLNAIDAGLNYKWPSVLVNILSQYSLNASKDVAEHRFSQKRTLKFWQSSVTKENEERIRERTNYKIRLSVFFSNFYMDRKGISSDNIKLISDYAVKP